MSQQAPPPASDDEDFKLPQPELDDKGPQQDGWYIGTIIAVRPPRPSTKPNDQGKYVLQSVIEWKLDGFPDYVQWSYVNVEGRHAKSNLHQLILAATGMRIDRTTELSRNFFLGLRCLLTIEKGDNGYMRVTGYKSPPVTKTIVPSRPPQSAIPPENAFAAPIEDDDDLMIVPF